MASFEVAGAIKPAEAQEQYSAIDIETEIKEDLSRVRVLILQAIAAEVNFILHIFISE